MPTRISKSLEIDGQEIVSQQDWNDELDAKHQQLIAWMKDHRYAAVLLRRNENIAWATGGAVDTHVCIPSETQVCALLITAAGSRYYITGSLEAPRLKDEQFGHTDFEPVIHPWYNDSLLSDAKRLAGGKLVTDYPTGDLPVENFYSLRETLCPQEIARYRWLCDEASAVTIDMLDHLEPGMSDYEIDAQVSAMLCASGILPSVLLMAVDQRIYNYRHGVSHGAVLKNYATVNLCARKWGLAVSTTRFVHFGKLPQELEAQFQRAAYVHAALLDGTREGATASQLFTISKDAYAKVGCAHEIENHHIGGATGYGEREWIATPSGVQVVRNAQAFSWNPSVRGAKVEDTVVLVDGELENLTYTPELPLIPIDYNGSVYESAGVLVREDFNPSSSAKRDTAFATARK